MKKLFKKVAAAIAGFFKDVFGKEHEFLRKNAHIAVEVTDRLKAMVENPVVPILTQLIPGKVDDMIVFKLQKILPKVATEIAIAKQLIDSSASNSQMIAAILTHVKTLTDDDKTRFLIDFSGKINEYLSDGKLTFAEAIWLAQSVYIETHRIKS